MSVTSRASEAGAMSVTSRASEAGAMSAVRVRYAERPRAPPMAVPRRHRRAIDAPPRATDAACTGASADTVPRPETTATTSHHCTKEYPTMNPRNFIELTLAKLQLRTEALLREDDGMSTVEYALGTVAAAAFGALLYTVVTGGTISDALTDIIQRALNTNA